MDTQVNFASNSDEVDRMTLGSFFARIYTWMVVGILITAFMSFITATTPLGGIVFGNSIIFYGIIAFEVVLMIVTQMLINKLPSSISILLFFIYAGLNGITLTGLMFQFTSESVVGIFLIAAALFGILAIIGYTTKKDLSGWGTFLMIGMVGVFISSIVNIFLHNSVFDMILSGVAILIFSGLTVYDNQLYKNIYLENRHDNEALSKSSAIGALHMYMNFIMIFVHLLKLFGDEK